MQHRLAIHLLDNHLVVLYDITKRKQEEAELRESEQRFGTVLKNLSGGVFAHDLEGRFLLVNAAAARNTGYSQEELMRMSVSDIDPQSVTRDDRMRLWHSLKESESIVLETKHRRKDWTEFPVEVHLNAITLDRNPVILPIAYDITERKRVEAEKAELEVQNRQLQKAESLGRMAGAIAHHFNNQLQVVMGNLEMAMDDLPRDAHTSANPDRSPEGGPQSSGSKRPDAGLSWTNARQA